MKFISDDFIHHGLAPGQQLPSHVRALAAALANMKIENANRGLKMRVLRWALFVIGYVALTAWEYYAVTSGFVSTMEAACVDVGYIVIGSIYLAKKSNP